MFNNLLLFILFFPLFAGVFICLFGNKMGLSKTVFIYISLYFVSIFCLIFQLIYFLNTKIIIQIKLFDLIVFENFSVSFSFLFDTLTIIMAFVVVFISFLVSNFSIWYMKGDPNHLKFLNYLNFFSFFMLLLVCSNSLIIIFIGWEGIGIFSYLLINFWSSRLNANRSALKAILINKIGDCFIYLFIFFYFFLFDSFNINDCKILLFSYSFDDLPVNNFKIQNFLALLLIIAAMAKSAQIFFHIWLPDAMEGPTPVSALLHAATMVTAGAFILIKFNWIILNNEKLLFFIAFIGLITNFIASLTGLFQNDIKKIIAYSTASQIGIIFISIGISKPNLSMFHIFNHAFFKALLFILAGVLIHYLSSKQDLRSIFKIKNNLFFVYSSLLIASLTLAGLPFLSSYFSKEFIIQNSFLNSRITKDLVIYFLNISVCTTILYTLKIVSFIFTSDNVESMTFNIINFNHKKKLENLFITFQNNNQITDKTPRSINLITIFLSFFSICIGILFTIIFNLDYFFFGNNFSYNLNLEKGINVLNFEYSCFIIFFWMILSFFFYWKFLDIYIYYFYFYGKCEFFKIFFETKFFIESFFFFFSRFFYFSRDLTKIIDKQLIENIFVAYWKERTNFLKFYLKTVTSKIPLLVLFLSLLLFDFILFYVFPEFILIFFIFSLLFIIWDFIEYWLLKRYGIDFGDWW